MNIQTVTYELKGLNGILFHNINSMLLKKPARVKHEEWESTREFFEAKMYKNDDGTSLIIPFQMIQATLKAAAQKSGLRQAGKRSTYASVINAVVFKIEDLDLGVSPADAKEDASFVKVSNAKVLRKRPRLDSWSGRISFAVETTALPLDVLDELMTFAGQFVGYGDRRPLYGRFEVKRVK